MMPYFEQLYQNLTVFFLKLSYMNFKENDFSDVLCNIHTHINRFISDISHSIKGESACISGTIVIRATLKISHRILYLL